MENKDWHKDHELLKCVTEQIGHAAELIDRQKDVIKRLQLATVAMGVVGVVGCLFTFGGSLFIAGGALALFLMYLAEISDTFLQTKEMENFDTDWEKVKFVARLQAMGHYLVHFDGERFKEWAKRNLDKASADAIVHFLSAPSSCDPKTTDRLKRLNKKQIELLLSPLVNTLVADLSAFELMTGSMTSEKADAASILNKLSGEIKTLAENEDKRQKELRKAAEKRKRTLGLEMNQQKDFYVHSQKGGTFRLRTSDIILDVPPGAIPVKEAHIKAAVCTNFHHIHTKFELNDDERVVSPLVQYKLQEPFELLKPVSVSLPHLLPENFDLDKVYVYHVSRNEDGTFNKQRVVDYTTSVQQDDSTKGQNIPCITIETSTFCYFFICAVCETEEFIVPASWAAVSGEFTSRRREQEDQQFKVMVFIWDKRLSIKDFRADYGVPLFAQTRPLQGSKPRENTKLHISVKTQPGQSLAQDDQGRDLTKREEVFELTDDDYLSTSISVPLTKEWLLYAKYRAESVAVCIEVEHHLLERHVTNTILYIITRVGTISPEEIEALQSMDLELRERVAQGMGISQAQLQHLVK